MGGVAESHSGDIQVEELDGISNINQAEKIAQHYANVSSEYQSLGKDPQLIVQYKGTTPLC